MSPVDADALGVGPVLQSTPFAREIAAAIIEDNDDVIVSDQGFEVRCNIHAFDKVSHALEQKGLKPDSAEIAYIPITTVPVSDPRLAQSLVKLHDALDEMDDVQAVFSNEELDPSLNA